MKLGNRHFAPSFLIILLYLVVGASMLALGIWQLQRANEKIVMQQAADEATRREPIPIEQLDAESTASRYARVALVGRFEPEFQFLWDNRIAAGRAGFEVITPFRITRSNQLVLVNRGWLPIVSSRQSLPVISMPVFSRQDSPEIELTAVFTQPSIGFSGGDAVNSQQVQWPKLLQHFEYGQLAEALGEPVVAGLAQLERNAQGEVLGVNLDGMEFYPDNWQPVAFGPERHYGYAFQWFAMFVALSTLFLILNTKKIVTDTSS